MTRHHLLTVAPLILAAAPAQASDIVVDLPAGRLADAVLALGKQTRASIGVDGAALWERRVPALKGAYSLREAVQSLARSAGADVRRAGPGGWLIVERKAVAQARTRPLTASPRPADPSPAGNPSDIVVTASKRNVRLGNYAGQVSRIDGDDLAIGQVGGTEAIESRLVSVSSTHLGAGRNKLFIRGIADSSFTGPTQSTVGQYVGDLRLSYNAPDPDLRLYDVASVEVLEGPQGTLYGAGSLGGIIRIVPQAPQPGETHGWVQVGASATEHGDPGADGAAIVNVPLAGETITLRALTYGIREGGYIDNPVRREDDINRTDTWGGRATLRFLLGEGWTVDLGGIVQRVHGADSQYTDRDGSGLTRASRVAQGFETNYGMGQIVVAGDWDNLHFRSSSGIVRQRLMERYDATVPAGRVLPGTGTFIDARMVNASTIFAPPMLVGIVISVGETRLFKQRNRTSLFATESRLWQDYGNGSGWVVGASYTANRTRLERSIGPEFALVPTTGVTNRIGEITVYGEGTIQPLRGLLISGGGRLSRSRLSGQGEDIVLLPSFAAPETVATRHELSFLPSASIVARVWPGLSLYARYQGGFRPGGLAVEGNVVRHFRNDRVSTLESGLRFGRPGLDPLDLVISLSHTRWRDIQADFIDAVGLPSTANIGDGRIWTGSAAGSWEPIGGLRLSAGATINGSRIDHPEPLLSTAATASVSRVPNVARWTARLGMDYSAPITADLDLRLSGSARYVGKSRLGVGPLLGELQGNYLETGLNARVGRPALGVTLGLTNLTDEVGNRFALGTPFATGRSQITPLRPRSIRIGLDAAF